MHKNKSLLTIIGLLTATMFFTQECQSETTPQAPTAAPAPAPTAPTATTSGAGSIKVKVAFTGTAPVPMRLKRDADPFCAKTPMTDEEVVVNPNGTLKNVAVRIVKGAAPAATPPADALLVDQTNCMYRPRVWVGVVNQKLLVRNSDPILHNVHSYSGTTTVFNQAQMKGSKDIEKTVAAGVTKLKCDVHPWMTGYVIGSDNSFICVTGDLGDCSLANVPAGAYTIETWHEKYGAKTIDVTMGAGENKAVDVSFVAQ